jgi:hypothetical protein
MRQPNIPRTVRRGKPEDLPSELDRLTGGLLDWAKTLPDETAIVPAPSELFGTPKLAFGQLTRLAPADGEVVRLILPQLDRRRGGQKIQIARLNSLGTVVISAPDQALIDGLAEVMLYASQRVTTIYYDGASSYLSDGSAVHWGIGL